MDQGSAAEIMYLDLYKGLNLRAEDLTPYSSPLVSFEGKIIIPNGQIRLPVQTGLEVVEVDFIVVDAYSPYTAIVARPWLHTLGAIFSTLHQKVKYPSEGQIRLLVQTGSEVVEVDFIVVDAYSPYTAIVVRLWLHTLGAISSTLHQKVKYSLED